MVGTVPLEPLEPFESLELFGDFSVLEIVFLRRNSLKKGIVVCSWLCELSKENVSFWLPQNNERVHGEEWVVEDLPPELMRRDARP